MAPVVTARLVLTPVGTDNVNDLVLLCSDPEVAFWTGPWTRDAVAAWTPEVRNLASRAVVERLGMRSVGIIRREGRIEGCPGIHPEAPFALIRL